ncbi:cation:proton antiporter domain-containing protein [Tahibacter harae]|uniref:Cation:proton antiporter n=1 Tax=Tahibacter harae TaxID=2963937 RepID=A0ABT1QWK1_9GAMM|nr:cation:proton antiporter [Tahibacter harae]MCQ4166666.1 cation:proton antiporter [Tahibacter harae]
MKKSLLSFYLITTIACLAICVLALHLGQGLVPGAEAVAAKSSAHAGSGVFTALVGNLRHPLAILLLQLVVVIGAAKLLGALFQRLKQPAVIGEMIAGILLGPSLLGATLPGVKDFLFPATSMGGLQLFAQIGVILFMFCIGIELDLAAMRKRAQAAVAVSHVSIVAPFALGCLLALGVYSTLAPQGVAFAPFALFMGIAMSITAFPVLARILKERGLSNTPLGNIAIACAAVDDVTAWCILAVVVAIGKANGFGGAAVTIVLSAGFTLAMLMLARPRLELLSVREADDESGRARIVVGAVVFAFLAALCTETIGIHALFGAFLAGALIPAESPVAKLLRERIETFSGAFLLPLFFAFTGLRTQIGMLDSRWDWLICAGIIALAIAGKFGGSLLAARFTGMNWRDAASLGALMNTRGLMELIVLNIGYDMGILSPRLFAMMVIMALVTTMMTGPLLTLIERWRPLNARMTSST